MCYLMCDDKTQKGSTVLLSSPKQIFFFTLVKLCEYDQASLYRRKSNNILLDNWHGGDFPPNTSSGCYNSYGQIPVKDWPF